MRTKIELPRRRLTGRFGRRWHLYGPKRRAMLSFQMGARITVIAGEYLGLSGTVLEVTPYHFMVRLDRYPNEPIEIDYTMFIAEES